MVARGCLPNVNAYMKINYPDFSCAMEKLERISFWGGAPQPPSSCSGGGIYCVMCPRVNMK